MSNLTAFAEAAEMDGVSYLEMRMKLLERRIARLEVDDHRRERRQHHLGQ